MLLQTYLFTHPPKFPLLFVITYCLGHFGERRHQTGSYLYCLDGKWLAQRHDVLAQNRSALSRKPQIVQLRHNIPLGPADHWLRSARIAGNGGKGFRRWLRTLPQWVFVFLTFCESVVWLFNPSRSIYQVNLTVPSFPSYRLSQIYLWNLFMFPQFVFLASHNLKVIGYFFTGFAFHPADLVSLSWKRI